MIVAIALAVSAAVLYGVSDFVGGLVSRRVTPWSVALTGQLGGFTVILVLAWAVGGQPRPVDFAWTALAGFGSAVGTVCLYRGLGSGRMGVVAPVSAVGAAVLPVALAVATGERPQVLVWIGIAAAVPGIWLVSREPGAARQEGRSGGLPAGTADGLLAGVGFGVLFAAVGQVPASSGVLPLAMGHVTGACFTIALAVRLRQRWRPRSRSWLGMVVGVLGGLGTAAFAGSAHAGHLSVSAVLASFYPGVTILCAALLLRERIVRLQGVGLALCAASVAVVAAG